MTTIRDLLRKCWEASRDFHQNKTDKNFSDFVDSNKDMIFEHDNIQNRKPLTPKQFIDYVNNKLDGLDRTIHKESTQRNLDLKAYIGGKRYAYLEIRQEILRYKPEDKPCKHCGMYQSEEVSTKPTTQP